MQELAPIILFVYNRPWHTKQTVEALKNNLLAEKSELYIFSDGPKNKKDVEGVKKIREFIKKIEGFSKIAIVERGENLGLANSVINGVTEIFQHYDRVIVLEDDIETSPKFLEFMNDALEFYEENKKIFSVTAYCHPIIIPGNYKLDVFIMHRASSWGWGTWIDRWQKVDWDVKDYTIFKNDKVAQKKFNICGKDLTPMLKSQMSGHIDSWAIRWTYSHFKNNAYCIYPTKSLINNIGTDNSGTHFSRTNKYDIKLNNVANNFILTKDLKLNYRIIKSVNQIVKPSLLRKAINYLKYDFFK